MKFDVKCVKDFLLENGFVFTVRKYKYKENFCIFNKVLYKRIFIKQVHNPCDLEDFLKFSGFSLLREWSSKVFEFIGNKDKYLYLVVIDYDNFKLYKM